MMTLTELLLIIIILLVGIHFGFYLIQRRKTKADEIKAAMQDEFRLSRGETTQQSMGVIQAVATMSGKLSNQLDKLMSLNKEMGELAPGVKALNRVFSNIKTRGTWGEVQLGELLDQILIRDQYVANFKPRPNSREIVEYAIRMPGGDDGNIWLPIDAKFPTADYERLQEAVESGNVEQANQATKDLKSVIIAQAKNINKYIVPQRTTDFAIMFLPSEGLNNEVTRDANVLHILQNDHRVVPAGPVTLAAIVNGLRMGFRSLAIEKHSSKVWKVLSKFKTKFLKFDNEIANAQKNLMTHSNTLEKLAANTRAINKELKDVDELPINENSEASPESPQSEFLHSNNQPQ